MTSDREGGKKPPNEPIQLPEPDPDNITVLTNKLPNEPILPWNRYDSPWREPEEETSKAKRGKKKKRKRQEGEDRDDDNKAGEEEDPTLGENGFSGDREASAKPNRPSGEIDAEADVGPEENGDAPRDSLRDRPESSLE
ncbi:hypothetical protein JJD41_00505 [Oxynema sp. CENA135]|uniref:hypothetical protein n=1 Tax=Oxynema sp. CENA135 TaxID=984206 RepID=UPI00190B05B8|nr:hypothetical protein [Oxynema sp. CENA135]MBK4728377.1 hypothetical protein [Oxynema sp. CENA135]